jgi:hypothetical protein
MNQSTLILITKPADGESLCRTCYFAHTQTGYRESEEAVFCAFGWGPVRPVRFKVRDCTDYLNRTVPTRKEMEEMALIIPTEPKRKIGGFAGMGFVSQPEEDEEDLVSTME